MEKTAGPRIRVTPEQRQRVCNGCEHLEKQPGLRGHNRVTDNYFCQHPNFENEKSFLGDLKGKLIHYNHSGYCNTPEWCPFLNNQNL